MEMKKTYTQKEIMNILAENEKLKEMQNELHVIARVHKSGKCFSDSMKLSKIEQLVTTARKLGHDNISINTLIGEHKTSGTTKFGVIYNEGDPLANTWLKTYANSIA